ncbi:PKD domain-containing protein [Streptomyces sp. TBY4]|uniref:PKD domain-containing protein n=1 Tax=Streptomyces sp. TBY4 TaxID=2962030 RepID=UPI0035B2721C
MPPPTRPLLDLHDPALFPAGGTGGPDATFTGACDNTGRTCTLDAGLSTGSGLTYRWDFGDGTTGTELKPSHTYPAATATYTAKLTVTDAKGATGTTPATIACTKQTYLTICAAS